MLCFKIPVTRRDKTTLVNQPENTKRSCLIEDVDSLNNEDDERDDGDKGKL